MQVSKSGTVKPRRLREKRKKLFTPRASTRVRSKSLSREMTVATDEAAKMYVPEKDLRDWDAVIGRKKRKGKDYKMGRIVKSGTDNPEIIWDDGQITKLESMRDEAEGSLVVHLQKALPAKDQASNYKYSWTGELIESRCSTAERNRIRCPKRAPSKPDGGGCKCLVM